MHLELRDKYAEIAKWVGTPSTVDQLLGSIDLPYSARVMAVPLLPKFKVCQMELYDGTKDLWSSYICLWLTCHYMASQGR